MLWRLTRQPCNHTGLFSGSLLGVEEHYAVVALLDELGHVSLDVVNSDGIE